MEKLFESDYLFSDSDFEGVLTALVQERLIPGVAACVFRAGSILAVGAKGTKKRWGEADVSPSDPFHLGANTKAFTADLAGALVEAGLLRWDTLLLDCLPVLKPLIKDDYHTLTLEQLLRHRSGLQDGEHQHLRLKDQALPMERRVDFAAQVLARAPLFPPGQFAFYSDAAYAVAAAMLEQAGGYPWQDLMQRHVFDPLHLAAGFGWPARDDPTQPWGHTQTLLWLRSCQPDLYPVLDVLAPALDIHCSLEDYVRFLQHHLRGLGGQAADVLAPATLQAIHQSEDQMAMGWGVQPLAGYTAHVHTGRGGGFHALAVLLSDCDLGVVLLANADDRLTEKSSRRFLKDAVKYYADL
jgi:CubicO group peptidase (beta-lactamase class C family)